MRRLPLALALALACGSGALTIATAAARRATTDTTLLRAREPLQQHDVDSRLSRVEQWLKAVTRHEPGRMDDAAVLVASWSNTELRTLWIDSNVVVQLMRSPRMRSFSVRSEGQPKAQQIRYTSAQFQRLKALACAAAGTVAEPDCVDNKEIDQDLLRLSNLAAAARFRGDDNYILRRGALLHADIAMFVPPTSEPITLPGAPGPQRIRMSLSDGLEIALGQVATHWELARMLLDYIKPRGADRASPGRDAMVRQWYRATAAWMQSREDHETLHLARALEIFPADPDILFLSGCQHETYAAPHIQSAMRSAALPTGVTFDVGSDRTELRQAEGYFRKVLEIQANHTEARMRLGRVLGLLGHHAEAAGQLRQAVAGIDESDEQLLYYADLFLGAEEEALGHHDIARASYDHAAELYPEAQSPHLAVSHLARRNGDRASALRAIQQVFALSSEASERDDPWWTYHVAQARDAGALLEELRKPFLTAEPQ